ncbi:bifunctional phosphopantothenoylcysteine decarboxylase/phosphopantothenate--cysteine ligase CoaBC [Candidatus Pelagibacter sp.]|nr:bifunctional phosphopantothenoylcysteine decarboxylase/phosphopantothenate--cysteine ligase CoaBC [Candidatus Pelagibacter sp.]
MKDLTTKKILFVICGGVSAYKSLETIRLFKKNNAEIKTILTKSAKEFVTPLSIASLSQGKVYDDLFNVENETEMDHIALSRWADVIVVAPATANTLSKLSQGSSEDLASTVILASNKQVFLAPAMNVRMWEHPSTKDNFKILKSFGYKFIGPVTGDMACGEYGEGKMSDPYDIFNKICSFLFSQLKNKKIKALVTAGPTNEYIDPVRFITNKSSGKQGYEIAKSLSRRGFNTTLISGPTNLTIDEDIRLIKVETAEEMFKATQKNLPTDIAVFTAAVADYKINKKSQNKIKKQENLNINLEQNIDILNYVSNHNSMRPKLVIGFAAETSNLDKNAISKLKNKNCDWIVANDVSKKNIGFESDYNKVTIHYKDTPNKKEKLSLKKKSEISEEIVDRIVNQIN